MKIIFAFAILLFLATTRSHAQTYPGDSTAQYLGSIPVSITLQSPSQSGPTLDINYQSVSTDSDVVVVDVIVWAVGPNINYVGDVESITVSGSGNVIGSISTDSLLGLLSAQAVLDGIANSYSPCYSITTPGISQVFQPDCVTRTGSGILTQFSSCVEAGLCNRAYQIYCTSTSDPIVTYLTGCEP